MYRILVVVGAAACCCLILAWRRSALIDRSPRLSRDHLRRAGWVAGLLAMAVSVIVASGGNSHLPAYLAAAAAALIILCAPPQARRLMPLAAVAVGLAGLALALASTFPPYAGSWVTDWFPRASAWRVSLLVQSGVFLAAGLWLIWRARQSRSATAEQGHVQGGMGRWARAGGRLPWGLMLPPAAAVAVFLLDQRAGPPAWKAAVAAAVVALIVVVLVPAAAPDLAAAGLVVVGLCALSYVLSPPVIPHRAAAVTAFAQPKPFSAAPEGKLQGDFSAAPQDKPQGDVSAAPQGALKHAVPAQSPSALAHSLANGVVFASTDGPLELVAGIEAAAILALGVWLVPRTIGVHARALLRPEPDAELAGRVEQLTQTRADAVDTAAMELRRLERDLHDGAQARLVALGMNLRAAERLIPTSPQAAIALVAEAREASSRALTELRDLVRGVYPPVLADRGLADAVRALALDTPIRTETDINVPGRLDPPVESACYFAVAEALTNAVKHSGARLVQIRIRYSAGVHSPGYPARPSFPARPFRPARPSPGLLRIEVTDDGTGGADPARGSGLQGVERRLGTFDGILAVSSPPGGPTIIVMEIPCALSSRRTSSC